MVAVHGLVFPEESVEWVTPDFGVSDSLVEVIFVVIFAMAGVV